jgi:transposase
MRRLSDQHVLPSIVDGPLAVHEQVEQRQAALDKRVRKEAKADETTRRLMSVPGWAW